jgi:hypothetical protein
MERIEPKETTIIVIDPSVGFSNDDFAAEWNSQATKVAGPVALVKRRPETFDASILELIGRAADFLAIASFIGVPTVYEIIRRLRADSVDQQPATSDTAESRPAEEGATSDVAVEEVIVDYDDHRRLKRITIRQSR